MIGDPMTFEIVEWVKENIETLMENATALPMKNLTGNWWELKSKKKEEKKKKKKKAVRKVKKEKLISEVPEVSKSLLKEFEEKQNNPAYMEMQQVREKLPACINQKKVMKAINKSQVVVISGDTGCGKSTQVPQFILDDAILKGKGSSCNIVCTQPRRISAVGLADRVSAERAESVGETV